MKPLKSPIAKLALIGTLAVIGIACLLIFIVFLPRAGKTAVVIETLPDDATIRVDGKKIRPGTNHLTPGEHTLNISREGFTPKEEEISVRDDRSAAWNSFFISLETDGEVGERWLKTYQAKVTKFEEKSGSAASEYGDQQRKDFPIVEMLPINSPIYDIGYLANEDKDAAEGEIIVTVDAAEQYRQNAITYLRSQDVRISNYQFMFYDEENPFK